MPSVPGFLPSTSAPLFKNGPWPPGSNFNVSIMGLPPIVIDGTHMGYCGGMAFTARDIFEARTPQLQSGDPTTLPSQTVSYIQNRLLDSFQPVPAIPATWSAYDQALNHDTIFWGQGTYGRSVLAAPAIMASIATGGLCPIGVVLVQSFGAWDVFQNHVELVYGFELDPAGQLTLHVYDCNAPGRDDITISLDISSPAPARTITTNGTSSPGAPGTIRGFFQLSYTHVDPSPVYVDDGMVAVTQPPPAQMIPGEQASVTVLATNLGSTTWTPAGQYRLGSADPQDNTNWGRNRAELPGSVLPRFSSALTFDVTAPAAAGTYDFSWQMVREMVHWFGQSSGWHMVPVGEVTTPVCEQLSQQWQDLKAQLDDVQQEIAAIDWSDPIPARAEGARLRLRANALAHQLSNLEAQQMANGCAPGPG